MVKMVLVAPSIVAVVAVFYIWLTSIKFVDCSNSIIFIKMVDLFSIFSKTIKFGGTNHM